MTDLATIRTRILTDDDFVMSEADRLQYIYRLKREIRWGQDRAEEVDTESVAEHVFGMEVCAQYFLPLEDEAAKWNQTKIMQMILWHDVEEIETGDIIGYLKTEKDRQREFEAQLKIAKSLPQHLTEGVQTLLTEYEERTSIEARFVKAIDKIETHIQMFNENGKQINVAKNCTLEQHQSIKDKYIAPFPYIKRFSEVLTKEMVEQGFFVA